jgi:hypothetical protein
MTFRFAQFVPVLVALSACGYPHAGADPAPIEIQSAKTPGFSVTWQNREPSVVGGAWSRKFHVQVQDPATAPDYWTVEKRYSGAKEWVSIGFTNHDGSFVDSNVSKDAEYRFGEILESGLIAGAWDEVLEGKICPKRVNAYRVVVPKAKQLIVGDCEMQIRAELFEIDGSLISFPAGSTGGGSAGALLIEAKQVQGKGEIRLEGQKGIAGARGAAGAAGRNGTFDSPNGTAGSAGATGAAGGRGGNGGRVAIHSSERVRFKISVQGGAPGDAGPGGVGGMGGKAYSGCETHFHGRMIGDVSECRQGKNGSQGTMGAKGSVGQQGSGGQIEVLN